MPPSVRTSQLAEDLLAASAPRTTKERLRAHGIRPRKRLGQCFLLSDRDAARIADLADVGPADLVVEIGAGTGVLTAPLAERARRVVAVEIDDRLRDLLVERFAGSPNVEILRENYLRLDLARIARDNGAGKIVVVGNLPYYITSEILVHTIEARAAVSKLVAMVQREVARRLLAPPGSREYGSLTILCRFHAQVNRLLDVRKGAFFPEPDVSSTLVEIRFRERPAVETLDEERFFQVVRAAFQARRKMLGGSLAEAFDLPREALAAEMASRGVPPAARAEQLDLGQFEALAGAIAALGGSRPDRGGGSRTADGPR
jgi:16S rRNA (adenine1518-N6/adenine1519-N6)-dimethyltransferase